ncbi:hypothetical protein IWX49DRAFT_180229 [Phyllosticta citricarpa]|uniref:Uncharacterized protein n=2 Tax=Phyllosticta TaxID=121621 RepID=A0ABR1M3V8_9PEZI
MSSQTRNCSFSAAIEDQRPPQLVDYAFNLNGWAVKIPDGVPKTDVTILYAYSPTQVNWEIEVGKAQARDEEVIRETLDLTPQELSTNEDEVGPQKFLLVGVTFPNLPKRFAKLPVIRTGPRSVGHELRNGGIIGPDDSKVPVLVVTPIVEEPPAYTRFFALIKPLGGLCHPFMVTQHDIFYLSMFRDGTAARHYRRSTWNKLVQRHCFRPTSGPWVVRSAESRVNVDILAKFLDNCDEEWDELDSEIFVRKFREKWPDAPLFDSFDVGTVKYQLLFQGITVEQELFREFVVQVMARVKYTRSFGADVSMVALQAISFVRLCFGPSP